MTVPLFRFSIAVATPVVTIASGDEIEFTVPDSDGLGPDLVPRPRDQFDLPDGDRFPGNPVYGPISVEGAAPGDLLQADILGVWPDRAVARTLIAPSHGFIPDELLCLPGERLPERMVHWRLDGGYAVLDNSFGNCEKRLRLRPFIGTIGAAPPEGSVSTMDAGDHGGNLDLPDLGPGTSLLLPVRVPGGLLAAGDLHAAQGAGEMVGGGLEVSGKVRLRIRLLKNQTAPGPRYLHPQGRGAIATGATADAAIRQSFARMVLWMEELGLNRYDAYLLLSQSAEIRLGGLGQRLATAACFLPGEALV